MAEGGAELDVPSLKVSELREELKIRGLLATGVKAVLVQRLTDALEESRAAESSEVAIVVDAAKGDRDPPLRDSGRSPRFRAVSSFPSVNDDSSPAAAQADNGAAAPALEAAPPPAAQADALSGAEPEAELEPDAASLTVPALRVELEKLGLPVTGRKADLVQRLQESQAEGVTADGAADTTEPEVEAAAGTDSPEEPAAEAEAAAEEEAMREDAVEEAAAEPEDGALDVGSLKLPELRGELEKRGLSTAGRKSDMSARLTMALKSAGKASEGEAGVAPPEGLSELVDEPAAAPGETPEAEAVDMDTAEEELAVAGTVAAAVAAEPVVTKEEDEADEAPELDFEEADEQEVPESAPVEMEASPPPSAAGGVSRKRSFSAVPAFPGAIVGEDGKPRPAKLQKTESVPRVVGAPVSLAAGKGPREPAPAADMEPTPALLIEGFVRPFSQPQVRELLGQTGTVVSLWMPTIKNLAYVLYESAEEAEATRQALHDLQWPKDGKRLLPKFVTVEEAQAAAGGLTMPRPSRAAAKAVPVAEPRPTVQEPIKGLDARAEIAVRRQQRQAATAVVVPVLDVDQLFRKTAVEPGLYWLPLTEKEAAKRAEARKKPAH